MDKFEIDEVLRDMKIKLPASLLQVKFGAHDVNTGSALTPTQVKDQPDLDWDADAQAFYTVVFNDLDAPSRADPKFREWHHWLVGNIPGKDVSAGEVLSEYVGSGPRQGSDFHRYVLLVYKQPAGRIEFAETRLTSRSPDGRREHSAAAFAAKHSLGDPVAGNYYVAEWDNYVPTLHAQLGLK